jgi:signal transduction histidine kinase
MWRRLPGALGSLRGLRVQLLLWTVLPLTLMLVAVAALGIDTHQRSMRDLVEELDARSARLAAAHLSGRLEERAVLLQVIAACQPPGCPAPDAAADLFDGGLAGLNGAGELEYASPSARAWQARPISELAVWPSLLGQEQPGQPVFSPLFVDPLTGRDSLLMGVRSLAGDLVVGAVSLERLGLAEIMAQVRPDGSGPAPERGLGHAGAVAFLVDRQGRVIFHPDLEQIGQDLSRHEGVADVILGQAGATYHREPDGQELVVGYAPVPGPGWGLIVQEPWEALIAPVMRLSLLAPLVVMAAALISGLAVTFGLRYVVRPLQALDRQAARLAWGDFSAVRQPVEGVQEIEDLRRTLAGMADQIQRYQSGMRDYIAAVTMAQEEERKRLARELHDETIQSLIALGHRVEMAQKALDKEPVRARQRLDELQTLVADIQAEVRRLSRALRPLYLEDLGLMPALEMLAQEVSRAGGLQISSQVEGEVRRLAADLELTAYRIAQEGLNNIVRHAHAQAAWLTICFAPHGLTLQVRDDGCGFEPPANPADLAHQGHFGLMGIHERALLLGGWMQVRSKAGAGTTLQVFLPLTERAKEQSSHG